jgi:alkanesulfonate monooxygenase SsuD/methylene tetrahydromethanopterin reductase-like flavin-dependent oxidoreductase (luciferase family)
VPDTVDHDARLRALHVSERRYGHRHRLHGRRLDPRDGAREIAGMYLANKVQNIQGSADTLLELAGIEQDEIRPVAEAMEQGGRLAAKAKVSDALLDKCRPIAGTPADCIEAIEEYRDAGCTHVMLELWGADRHEQIRLFGDQVLPHFRA